jgi:hypothetical protein
MICVSMPGLCHRYHAVAHRPKAPWLSTVCVVGDVPIAVVLVYCSSYISASSHEFRPPCTLSGQYVAALL